MTRKQARRLTKAQVREMLIEKLDGVLPDPESRIRDMTNWVWFSWPNNKDAMCKWLWKVGFHWSKTSQVWQHPCGVFGCSRAKDPSRTRAKYDRGPLWRQDEEEAA